MLPERRGRCVDPRRPDGSVAPTLHSLRDSAHMYDGDHVADFVEDAVAADTESAQGWGAVLERVCGLRVLAEVVDGVEQLP